MGEPSPDMEAPCMGLELLMTDGCPTMLPRGWWCEWGVLMDPEESTGGGGGGGASRRGFL